MNETQATFSIRIDKVPAISVMEILIALICMAMPAILLWAEGAPAFRESISNYVYMEQNAHIFGFLLTIAALMFIFNGVLYYQRIIRQGGNTVFFSLRGKWYNLLLGFSLLGVLLLPHKEFPIAHHICAGFFFLGSAVFTAFFHENENRVVRTARYVIAILSVLTLVSHFVLKIPASLLVAEWISLIVISVHYILDSLGVLGILANRADDFIEDVLEGTGVIAS